MAVTVFAGVLSDADAALIRAEAAESEHHRMLTAPVQQLMHERGWLRMLAPQSLAGAELPLPQAVRLEEALCKADGSTGWTVTLCAGAGWFAGFLAPDVARSILATPSLCVGGSGAPSGYADIEGDGYRISGRWDFATGAPMTTHFTMNAMLREDGKPQLDERGEPRMRAFILPASQVTVHENWHTVGLVATASHTFSVDGIRADASQAFDITAAGVKADGPLYRFPFLSLAFVTLAANVSGMALDFIEQARAIVARRRHHVTNLPLADMPKVRDALAHAPDAFERARERFYTLLDAAWQRVGDSEAMAEGQTSALHDASLELVDTARRAVDELYPLCGLGAADCRSSISRAWRDLHTASQHALMLPVPAR